MRRKFLYLINPISGARSKSTLAETIIKKTSARKIPFEIIATRKDGRYEDLPEKILKENITDVIICGGDGTVSGIVSALLQTDVSIGIIPRGSGNGLALAAGIPVNIHKALDIIFRGYTEMTDGLFINDRFSCMLCGMGFDAQVAKDFDAVKRRGLMSYIKISAINYFKAKTYPFIISSKEKNLSVEAFFLCAANSNQFGNHFTIAPLASLNDGLFDVVIAKKMNRLALPFSVLGQFAGVNAMQRLDEHINKKNIIYFQASALTIHNPMLAPLHIDGEPVPTAENIELKIAPKAFRLLRPSD
ncbi:MAG TPA: YegS/Rv2252/BmrU family lipid kinase [Flavitalea sp.]|nr:YegS/Rv2252/BmrU family lipid kinase [Flavitalea sp.]